MSGAAGIRAGKSYVEMGLNSAPLAAGLRATEARIKAFGASLAAGGGKLIGLGAAMAAPLGIATTTFAGFEKQMARVKAISNATPEEFARLTSEAKRLGEVTEYSASQAAQMMGEFALRGFKTNEILKATRPALEMATAGTLDLAEAAGIAGDIMGGMKIEAGQLGEVTDMLSYAFTNSATDLRQLGEAFKYVGPTASSMGFSVDEVTSALMVLANAGQKGEMAGTTLRGMLETMKDPANEARQELQRLGVVLDNGAGKFRRLDEILGDMQKGLSKLSDVDAASAISRIFTNRQTTGTSILMGNNDQGTANVDVMRGFQEKLNTVAAGTGARIQATQLDTLWGAWKLIESAMEGVAIVIGEALAPALRDLGRFLTDGVAVLNLWVKENRELLPVIGKTALVLIGVGAALTVASVGAMAFGTVLGGLVTAGTMIAGAVAGIAGAIGFLFTPVGAITALVVGGIAAWMAWTDSGQAAAKTISGAIGSMVSSVGELLGSMAQTFTQAWGGIVDAVKAGNLSLAGDIAWKGLMVVWQKGVNWLRDLWRGFSFYFVETFHQATTDLAQGLNNVWSGLEKMWFQSFAAIRSGWNATIDSIHKTLIMAIYNMKVAWLDWQHTVGAITKHTLTLEKDIAWSGDAEKKTDGARQQLKAILDARLDANRADIKALDEIEARRKNAELGMNQDHERGMQARQKERDAARKQDLAELARLEKELADAVKQASDAVAMTRWEKAGPWFGDYSNSKNIPTQREVNQVAGQAIGAGDTAGTFDANMIRFLVGDPRDGVEKDNNRKLTEAVEWLKRTYEALKQGITGGIFE